MTSNHICDDRPLQIIPEGRFFEEQSVGGISWIYHVSMNASNGGSSAITAAKSSNKSIPAVSAVSSLCSDPILG